LPLPLQDFRATLCVTPVVDGNRAFFEWRATVDCELDAGEERIAFFRDAFAGWLESLRRQLGRQSEGAVREKPPSVEHSKQSQQ